MSLKVLNHSALILLLLFQPYCQPHRFIPSFISSPLNRFLQNNATNATASNSTTRITDVPPGCGVLTLYPTVSPSPTSIISAAPPASGGDLTTFVFKSQDITSSDEDDVVTTTTSNEGSVRRRNKRERRTEEVTSSRSKSKKSKNSSKSKKSKKGHHIRDGHTDHGDPSTYTVDRCGQITYLEEQGMFSSITSPGSVNLIAGVGGLSLLYFLKVQLNKRRNT